MEKDYSRKSAKNPRRGSDSGDIEFDGDKVIAAAQELADAMDGKKPGMKFRVTKIEVDDKGEILEYSQEWKELGPWQRITNRKKALEQNPDAEKATVSRVVLYPGGLPLRMAKTWKRDDSGRICVLYASGDWSAYVHTK